nr:hypothetical protein [Tanacetum cinerariifolium]
MNHQTSSAPQIAYQSLHVTTQPMTESPLMDSGFIVIVFSPRDDPISCLNKAMDFLTAVASSRSNATSSGETMQADWQGLLNATTVKVENIWLGNALNQSTKECSMTEDLDTYDFNCDDISNAQAILMANISNYGSDVISE